MTSAVAEQQQAEQQTEEFVIEIMDDSGHSRVLWDPDDAAEVAKAEKAFNDARAEGYAAFVYGVGNKPGKVLTKFDPYAGRILMRPPMAGG